MKRIYIILITILLLAYSCKAQTNPLTEDEFYGITFNNIALGSIEETDANIFQMQSLFGNSLNIRTPDDSPSLAKEFSNDDIGIYFQDDSDTGSEYYILFIHIHNTNTSVKVKGITAKIGDHVNIFGNDFVFNHLPRGSNTPNPDDSSYRISFSDERFSNSILSFEIDKATDRIIEIQYNAF